MNRLTNTEADEAVSASFDAYPDDLDRPSKADIEAEAEWLRHHVNDPVPEGMQDRLVAALDRAIEAARETRREGER